MFHVKHHHHKHHRPKISLLIPFSSKDPIRRRNFKWLIQYWKCQLPDAEIIIGKSKATPFCKNNALNNAAQKATGKVLVIMDADAYISGAHIEHCADRILEELHRGNNLWYVPYRHLHRLTEEVTKQMLSHNPCDAPNLDHFDPFSYQVEGDGTKSKYGHRYGAMLMMFPREAYDFIEGLDERFKGWGGEDIALLRTLDTLWGKHKTTNTNIWHFWHPTIGADYKSRMWKGQASANSNSELANKYHRATRKPLQMRELINQGHEYRKNIK